jgi:hypothetical protein
MPPRPRAVEKRDQDIEPNRRGRLLLHAVEGVGDHLRRHHVHGDRAKRAGLGYCNSQVGAGDSAHARLLERDVASHALGEPRPEHDESLLLGASICHCAQPRDPTLTGRSQHRLRVRPNASRILHSLMEKRRRQNDE